MQLVKHETLTQCRAIFCWPTVYDAEKTLAQYWVTNMQVPFVCMWLMIVPAGTKPAHRVGTVLTHSLRRWIGVVSALGGRMSCFVVMPMGAIAQ